MPLHRYNTFHSSSGTPRHPIQLSKRAMTFPNSTSSDLNSNSRRNAYHSHGVQELVAYAKEAERSTLECRLKAQKIFSLSKLPPQSTISGMLKRNNVVLKKDGGKGRNIKNDSTSPVLGPSLGPNGVNLEARVDHSKRKRLSNFPDMEHRILNTTYQFLLQGIFPTTDQVNNAVDMYKPVTFNRSQFQRILDKYVLTCNLRNVECGRMSKQECLDMLIKLFPQISASGFSDRSSTPLYSIETTPTPFNDHIISPASLKHMSSLDKQSLNFPPMEVPESPLSSNLDTSKYVSPYGQDTLTVDCPESMLLPKLCINSDENEDLQILSPNQDFEQSFGQYSASSSPGYTYHSEDPRYFDSKNLDITFSELAKDPISSIPHSHMSFPDSTIQDDDVISLENFLSNGSNYEEAFDHSPEIDFALSILIPDKQSFSSYSKPCTSVMTNECDSCLDTF